MIIASRKKEGQLDGELLLVRDNYHTATPISEYPTVLYALENWSSSDYLLQKEWERLCAGKCSQEMDLEVSTLIAPLPRSYCFLDGSAFLEHIKLVRRARGAEMPEDYTKTPLMYQGISDHFLAPDEEIPWFGAELGLDFEAEVAVICDRVPMSVNSKESLKHIKLVGLLNDISLRELIPREVGTGFGFIQSKPASSLSPFLVTPEFLGGDFIAGRLNLDISISLNDMPFGAPSASEMHFSFADLIAHAARTRTLPAGTVIGSGTVSNSNPDKGCGCIAEKRTREILTLGKAQQRYLEPGDKVRIEAKRDGLSPFGAIEQRVPKE